MNDLLSNTDENTYLMAYMGYALCDEVLKLKVKHPNVLTITTILFMNQE